MRFMAVLLTQQVEPKSIPRKKTPPKILNQFFNYFKQVKTMIKFWGHVSRAVFEILTFKKLNFEPKSKVKVRNLVVLAIFSTFMQMFKKQLGKHTLKISP